MHSHKTSQSQYGYCTQCGAPLERNAKFCTECGQPVPGAQDTEELDTTSLQETGKMDAVSTQETGELDLAAVASAEAGADESKDPADKDAASAMDESKDAGAQESADSEEGAGEDADAADADADQDADSDADVQDAEAQDADAQDASPEAASPEAASPEAASPDDEATQPFTPDPNATQQIPLSEVVAAERATEETRQIPVVNQYAPPAQDTASIPRVTYDPGNTAQMPVVEQVQPNPHQAVSYSANNTQGSKVNGKKIALIAGIAVLVIAIIVLVVMLVTGNNQQQGGGGNGNGTSTVVDNTGGGTNQVVVNLTDTYTTKFPSANSITYPTFTFKFPSSWSVSNSSVNSRGEQVDLTNANDGTTITYVQHAQGTSSSDSVSFNNMEKVADSAFTPTGVQGSDYSDLGSFIVAKGTLNINGSDRGTCYALVPSSALDGKNVLDLRTGVPGFWYGSTLTFTCQPADNISDQTEQEIIAILASFAETSSANANASNSSTNTVTTNDDYVLPDSNSRYYSESELNSMSDYELYLARNEIFARHGRMFNNDDLKAYFSSKSWYHPTVAPDDFSDSVLNQYEKANVEAMSKIENARGSAYIS